MEAYKCPHPDPVDTFIVDGVETKLPFRWEDDGMGGLLQVPIIDENRHELIWYLSSAKPDVVTVKR